MKLVLLVTILLVFAFGQKSYDSYRLDRDIGALMKKLAKLSDNSGVKLSGNEDLLKWIID